MRLLAGKHLIPDGDNGTVLILGRDAFRDTLLNNERTYVSAEWGGRSKAFAGQGIVTGDLVVKEMMLGWQNEWPTRRDELMAVLRINPEWRMFQLSDGQRRRVQLFLALLQPSQLIILDEVLGLLDLITRQDFLAFLKKETETRNVSVVLATNIFDGLEDWTTTLVYVKDRSIGACGIPSTMSEYQDFKNDRVVSNPLFRTVEMWLRKEMQEKKDRKEDCMEQEGGETGSDRTALDAQRSAGGYAHGRMTSMMM